jgi:hypothetical protein
LNPPPPGTVLQNNATTPNFQGGNQHVFDHRNLPATQLYQFGLKTILSGANKTATVSWNTQQAPGQFLPPELPYGKHKIEWIVTDGCGNESHCTEAFEIKDCKKPSVVCLNGLSVNLMPDGTITLWASDFVQYVSDNCTPEALIQLGIRKSGAGNGFPLDASVQFSCNDLGTQTVQLWAKDLAGNADYCETYVIVQDNAGVCPSDPNAAKVSGVLATEMANGLLEASVEIAGSGNAIPSFSFTTMSDQLGLYHFNGIPKSSNASLTPLKDDNPLNGVSTYDLVLISKHILGIESLGSPYKIIAADANKSNSVTSFDIVELRKLILGIYDKLPNNTSWRFVDKAYVFPNVDNPFQASFPENKSLADLQSDQVLEDFIAVKIGDVNNNAIANAYMVSADRTAPVCTFELAEQDLKAGAVTTVHITPSLNLQGYQFTLLTKDVEILEVTGLKPGHYAIFEHAMTVSVDGAEAQVPFTLRIRPRNRALLSNCISVSSSITPAEAYQAGAKMDIALLFNKGTTQTLAGIGFELYQNQPNPFLQKTNIRFHLPSATQATLTIFDENSKVVYRKQGDFEKGYNNIWLDGTAQFSGAPGIYYYQLSTEQDQAIRKMIWLER